ncbi:Sapep family Mn(2+)-dependent dipeptidase [Vagococcus carniphilus]|uniref:Peptidase M20 n=1 Tax=Vagococcus carniphilus TaxID=218144 RepID=A0A430B8F7_9ENTE|nr:Sapep family Mn(2+)-dependent dipeptidase [Vagococcus carniphilus]QNN73858.1 Sapep family Mn(2+)-dependent dipeptidase [Vagococcus carniphilus]RSU16612.1 peptidase M20 [Vagococcus carniphilus]
MDISLFKEKLAEIETDFYKGLKRIMKINSVKSTPEKNAPFGLGPKLVLDEAILLSKELGFKTKIINNAVGYAQLGDDDNNYIGIVGHLDVVAEGDGWDYPPFDLTLDNGIFYGRGVLDNKGPIIANLYALYVLKEINYPITKTVRIIFGTDEESGSADIPLYLEKENPPLYGYTPDCKYPAVYGERGMIRLEIETPITDNSLDTLTYFKGNFDRSAIPDRLEVTINQKKYLIEGKRAPSNAPDLGENVITLFANKMVSTNLVSGDFNSFLIWLNNSLHNQHDGSGLKINYHDQESGDLSLTPFELTFEENKIKLGLSIRYPVTMKKEDLLSKLQKSLPKSSTLHVKRELPATFFDKNHPMIKSMTQVYEELTGLDGTPVTTTGATYARTMPNIVAFGPSFPGQKGIAHNKNEYMTQKDLLKNLEIYTYLLAELIK